VIFVELAGQGGRQALFRECEHAPHDATSGRIGADFITNTDSVARLDVLSVDENTAPVASLTGVVTRLESTRGKKVLIDPDAVRARSH
jgi:hypothetical protein